MKVRTPGRRIPAPRREPDSGQAPGLSRRKIFTSAAGVAAAGVAGGSVLAGAAGSPARAADAAAAAAAGAAATTIEPGALVPAVVVLTDAATIAVDASLGNDFRVTVSGSRIMGNPANPADGQQIIFQVTQGGSGTLNWGDAYEFSADLPQPSLSTTAGHTDLFGFVYRAGKGKWLLAAFVNGFA